MEILITGSGDNMPVWYKRHWTSEVKMGGFLYDWNKALGMP